MSLWKAQVTWNVKDFNLWRRVSLTELRKTPQEAWRSSCCFRCDMGWGIWYLGVVMPHTAHMQLQAKKWILMEMQENPQTFQQHAHVSGVYISQSSCSFLRDTAQIYSSFSAFALINIHELILETALLCSVGWLCGYRCVIDQQITEKARGLDEYAEAASALPYQILTAADLELQCRKGLMYAAHKQCWEASLKQSNIFQTGIRLHRSQKWIWIIVFKY